MAVWPGGATSLGCHQIHDEAGLVDGEELYFDATQVEAGAATLATMSATMQSTARHISITPTPGYD